MPHIIGIDVGGSTTKIVGWHDGAIRSPLFITATDAVTSLFGAFGKYVYDNGIALHDIDRVMLTGVGSSMVNTPIYGLSTHKVDEFMANGLGARHCSGLSQLVAVSMGTGTSLVRVDGSNITRMGGIGMGGGTLQGLARQLLGTSDVSRVEELAREGDLERINLQIKDICATHLEGLPLHATASLFGKARQGGATECDLAKGLICMVLETIGSCAVLSQAGGGYSDFVLIGNMTRLEECHEIFPMMEDLYGVRFHIPEYAEYCTALGAALAHEQSEAKS
ncbi:MAG: type II pantothenate kinase [Muribaculaceae bacterium]|nr:type II pantothenate kinase [Muribaculaceae bacterium]